MFKSRSIAIQNGNLIAHGVFRNHSVRLSEIRNICLEPVVSLCTEIGVTVVHDEKIFFTDASSGFRDFAAAMNFDQIFGPGWYAKAEAGERLVWRRS